MATINGKALVKDGEPLDRVYANGQLVYNRNYVLNSSGLNASESTRPVLIGAAGVTTRSTLSYGADGITLTNNIENKSAEWHYQVAQAWANFSDTPLTPGKPFTFSVDVMGTVPQAVLRCGFTDGTRRESFKSFDINNTSWARVSITVTSIPTDTQLYFRIQGGINNQYTTGWSGGETLKFRYVKIEDGGVTTPQTPAPEDYI